MASDGATSTSLDAKPDGNGTQSSGVSEQTASIAQASEPISADEIALYDRQIRVWGVQAQEKIRTANILLIGLKGLGTEIAKNLVLAGIGSLHIVDDGNVTEEDLGTQFFVSEEEVGKKRAEAALPRIKELNPRVNVTVATDPAQALAYSPEYFLPFNLVIATELPFLTLTTLNSACRLYSKPFYSAQTFGMYGYIFADLVQHSFVISREKSNVATKVGPESATRSIIDVLEKASDNGKKTELVTKSEIYSPLLLANSSPLSDWHTANRRRKLAVPPLISCIRALFEYQKSTGNMYPSHTKEDLQVFTRLTMAKHQELLLLPDTMKSEFLRAFLQNLGCELSPVCAFLGGQLAQDAINVIGEKEQPIQNFLLFDGEESKGPVYALHPIFDGPIMEDMSALSQNGLMDVNGGMAGGIMPLPNGVVDGLRNGISNGMVDMALGMVPPMGEMANGMPGVIGDPSLIGTQPFVPSNDSELMPPPPPPATTDASPSQAAPADQPGSIPIDNVE